MVHHGCAATLCIDSIDRACHLVDDVREPVGALNDRLDLNRRPRCCKVKEFDWRCVVYKEDLIQCLRCLGSEQRDLAEWASAALCQVQVDDSGKEQALHARRVIHKQVGLWVKRFADADLCAS